MKDKIADHIFRAIKETDQSSKLFDNAATAAVKALRDPPAYVTEEFKTSYEGTICPHSMGVIWNEMIERILRGPF